MKLKTKMKHFRLVLNAITIVMVSCVFCACPSEHVEDPTPPSLVVSPSDFNFSSSKGEEKNMQITTDADATWTIYNNDLSSKISVSSSNGTGSTNITLRTKEDNDEQVEGKLQIVATKAGLSTQKNVTITIDGSLPTDCEVNVQKIGETDNDNMLIMSYGFACVMEWKSNTSSFLYKVYTDAEFNSMRGNNDKIIAEATKVGTTWKQIEIPSSGGIEIIYDECMPNTAYEFVWIPYTQSGKVGKIDSKHFVTKHNTDDQPLASVKPAGSVSQNDVQGGNSGSYYKWSIEQNRSSDSYYSYVCASTTETETMKKRNDNEYGTNKPEDGISVAWEIMNTVRNGWNTSDVVDFNKGNKSCREMLFTKSIKDGDFSFAHDPNDKFIQIVTWALDRNEEYSGMVYDVVYKVENGRLYPNPGSGEPDLILDVTPTSLQFSAVGGSVETKTLTINSNTGWTVSSSKDWCELDRTFGSNSGSIKVNVKANDTSNSRSALITITATSSGKYVEVQVTQDGKKIDTVIGRDDYDDDKNLDGGGTTTYTLSVGQTSLSTTPAGEKKNVTITSNDSWMVSSNQSWCTVSPTVGSNNGTIQISTSKNSTSSSRSATVTVKGTNSGSKTIAISQDAYTLSASSNSLQMKSEGESKTVSITSNDSWTVTSNQSWCTVSPSSGSNNGTITIKTAVNSSGSRSATVTIKGSNSGRSVTVNISQEAGTVIGRDEYGSDKEIK